MHLLYPVRRINHEIKFQNVLVMNRNGYFINCWYWKDRNPVFPVAFFDGTPKNRTIACDRLKFNECRTVFITPDRTCPGIGSSKLRIKTIKISNVFINFSSPLPVSIFVLVMYKLNRDRITIDYFFANACDHKYRGVVIPKLFYDASP